ncbi:unnamed protein product [Boreogadus saida]
MHPQRRRRDPFQKRHLHVGAKSYAQPYVPKCHQCSTVFSDQRLVLGSLQRDQRDTGFIAAGDSLQPSEKPLLL